MKLEILEVFRTLYRSGAGDFSVWCLNILIRYSFTGISEGAEANYVDHEVKSKALSILKEVVEDPIILEEIVNNSNFDDAHFNDDSFLIKWLSNPTALQILHESGWIERTLNKWKVSESVSFVKLITTLLNEELVKGSTDFSETYAFIFANPVFALSDDLRNDAVLLKRFPFSLIVAIEDTRSKILFEQNVQSSIVVDPSGLTINGNFENSSEFSKPMNISLQTSRRVEEDKNAYEDVYFVKVCMMIGKSHIDDKGQDIDLPYWITCDANSIRKKGQIQKHPGSGKTILRVRKSGCIFMFEMLSETKLILKEIKVKIKILPDNYQGKSMPPNLYAELAKTSNSIQILRESNQVPEFKEKLLDEKTSIMERKALLWIFGLIGSTDYGVELLDENDVIEEIIKIAEESTYLSVKGTALFALSMICRWERGKETLKSHQWYRADPQGITCLPKDHSKVFPPIVNNFEYDICKYQEKWDLYYSSISKYDLTKQEKDLLVSIVKIGSSLKSAEGEREVKYALSQNPNIFTTNEEGINMVHLVCNILSMYKFKFSTRKRIFQLIDKSIKANALDQDWEFYI